MFTQNALQQPFCTSCRADYKHAHHKHTRLQYNRQRAAQTIPYSSTPSHKHTQKHANSVLFGPFPRFYSFIPPILIKFAH